MCDNMTRQAHLRALCEEYWAVLASPPNAWGQHLNKRGVISHALLRRMRMQYGAEKTQQMLDEVANHKQHDTMY